MKSPQAIAQSLKDLIEERFGVIAPSHDRFRYSMPYLVWMCNQVIEHPEWEIDKSSRWVGYIQGVLVARLVTTVDKERDRVRNAEDVKATHKE